MAKKAYKKRKYTKRQKRKIASPSKPVNFSVSGPGLPQHARCKWAYQSQSTMGDGTTTANASIQLVANSGVDFYGTGGVEQAPTYDLLQNASAYLRHRIVGVKTTWRFINLNANPCRVAIYLSDQATDMKDISTYNLHKDKRLALAILGPTGGSRDQVVIKRYWYFPSCFGKKVLTDNDYQCPYNSDGSLDKIYIYAVVQTLDNTTYCKVLATQDTVQYARLEDLGVAENFTPD